MTEGVLGEIVARKRSDVAARFDGVSLDELRARAQSTRRSLKTALAKHGARFIMEVKRASPSQGRLRENADPAALARAYAGAADAISVVTDQPYFAGSADDLRAVRAAFDGPLLAKDFIIDLRQVPEARIAGADAVLVMLSVLDDPSAAAVIAEVRRLGMDALVEAHTEGEVRRAVALGAEIIGINNRDLRTLEVDLAVTERLADLVPADCLLVSESGIIDRGDVDRLSGRVDAFLVGSSLMRAQNPRDAGRALASARVKICGLTREEDVQAAAAIGAAFGGIIMVPGTPRAVSRPRAEALTQSARVAGLPLIGVFRNEKVMQVALTARALELHAVQLHGEEDGSYVRALRSLLPDGCEIWTASAVGPEVPEARPCADRTVFDTLVNGHSGGTGKLFDWSRVEGRPDLRNGLLAGGLKPENVRSAARLRPFALDVSSGLEAALGVKDPRKMHAFFDALRPAKRGEVQPC